MAIQHSRIIDSLEVLNSGDQDVVCRVRFRFVSYDDSDQERTTIESGETFDLSTDGRTSSSDGWVAYASLDQATIEGWLGSEFTDAKSRCEESNSLWIDSVLNPPAPPTVNKALPW